MERPFAGGGPSVAALASPRGWSGATPLHRRRAATLLLVLWGLALLSAACGSDARRDAGEPAESQTAAAPAPPRQPDIYVYLIDTLRPDHLGIYGYDRPTSPHLDSLAADAVVFRSATSASPWTRPAVASLMTGLLPSLHGVRGRLEHLPPGLRTWAEVLAARGYRTEGLYTNPHVDSTYGFGRGFDLYAPVMRSGERVTESRYLHEAWLALPRPGADRPLFQYLHALDPHAPYEPLRRYRLQFGIARAPAELRRGKLPRNPSPGLIPQALALYDGEIRQNDEALGRFLAELKRRHVYANSWIVVTSDHGEEFWEHGSGGHGHGLWENLLRIPLVIKPPGGGSGAIGRELSGRADDAIALRDVADLIGSYLPGGWQSLSLANARRLGLDDKEIARWVRTAEGRDPPIRHASFSLDGGSGWMVEGDSVKLVWRDLPKQELRCFDLTTDPAEVRPLRKAQWPPSAGALRKELSRWVERVARGLEIRYTGTGPGPRLRLTTTAGLREVVAPVGGRPPRLRVRPRWKEVLWTPGPGGVLYVRGMPGARWTLHAAGADSVPLWPLPPRRRPRLLEVTPRDFGRDVEAEPPTPQDVPAALQEQLRALGYVN